MVKTFEELQSEFKEIGREEPVNFMKLFLKAHEVHEVSTDTQKDKRVEEVLSFVDLNTNFEKLWADQSYDEAYVILKITQTLNKTAIYVNGWLTKERIEEEIKANEYPDYNYDLLKIGRSFYPEDFSERQISDAAFEYAQDIINNPEFYEDRVHPEPAELFQEAYNLNPDNIEARKKHLREKITEYLNTNEEKFTKKLSFFGQLKRPLKGKPKRVDATRDLTEKFIDALGDEVPKTDEEMQQYLSALDKELTEQKDIMGDLYNGYNKTLPEIEWGGAEISETGRGLVKAQEELDLHEADLQCWIGPWKEKAFKNAPTAEEIEKARSVEFITSELDEMIRNKKLPFLIVLKATEVYKLNPSNEKANNVLEEVALSKIFKDQIKQNNYADAFEIALVAKSLSYSVEKWLDITPQDIVGIKDKPADQQYAFTKLGVLLHGDKMEMHVVGPAMKVAEELSSADEAQFARAAEYYKEAGNLSSDKKIQLQASKGYMVCKISQYLSQNIGDFSKELSYWGSFTTTRYTPIPDETEVTIAIAKAFVKANTGRLIKLTHGMQGGEAIFLTRAIATLEANKDTIGNIYNGYKKGKDSPVKSDVISAMEMGGYTSLSPKAKRLCSPMRPVDIFYEDNFGRAACGPWGTEKLEVSKIQPMRRALPDGPSQAPLKSVHEDVSRAAVAPSESALGAAISSVEEHTPYEPSAQAKELMTNALRESLDAQYKIPEGGKADKELLVDIMGDALLSEYEIEIVMMTDEEYERFSDSHKFTSKMVKGLAYDYVYKEGGLIDSTLEKLAGEAPEKEELLEQFTINVKKFEKDRQYKTNQKEREKLLTYGADEEELVDEHEEAVDVSLPQVIPREEPKTISVAGRSIGWGFVLAAVAVIALTIATGGAAGIVAAIGAGSWAAVGSAMGAAAVTAATAVGSVGAAASIVGGAAVVGMAVGGVRAVKQNRQAVAEAVQTSEPVEASPLQPTESASNTIEQQPDIQQSPMSLTAEVLERARDLGDRVNAEAVDESGQSATSHADQVKQNQHRHRRSSSI